jgi:sulfate adenylyltransferase
MTGTRLDALVDLLADEDTARAALARVGRLPSWRLSTRQLLDLEMLAGGGFTPLTSFLGKADYESVCDFMRLADGTLWPVPVTLDVSGELLGLLGSGGMLVLRDPDGTVLATMEVSEVWRPDRHAEAEAVFGTTDEGHPGVRHLLRDTHPFYVSGALTVLRLPSHYDHVDLRRTPRQVRDELARRGWDRLVAFQTRNPMHRAHQQLTLRAAKIADAKLLINPVVGIGKPGDVDAYTRVRCYRALLPSYPPDSVMLSLLPLAMRMAGPREAVWHALIRRNYGATHFIVGRDHAGPGFDAAGRPFYPPNAAQELAQRFADEIGVEILGFHRMVYVPRLGDYLQEDEVADGEPAWSISGTELRERLSRGEELPAWFTPPQVAAQLRGGEANAGRRGFTVLLTGLSGAGKSTIAQALCARLREAGPRPVSLLDGDLVRQTLSSDLGFTRTDRDRNIRRIGFVAAEITKHHGIAICAPIAPYDSARRDVARMVGEYGGFLLVHVATSLQVCESRDSKGLYAQARAGILPGLTGVEDPYEVPADPDLVGDTETESVESIVSRIVELLRDRGLLAAEQCSDQPSDQPCDAAEVSESGVA